jgi:hypothetical protein
MRDWIVPSRSRSAYISGSWTLLVVLARRPPSGLLKDRAAFLADRVTTA